jgi:predicted  nucleic acid-binding Zn-ribbon protein
MGVVEAQLSLLVQAQRVEERLVVLKRRADSLPVELSERTAQARALEAEADQADGERKAALVQVQALENDVRVREARVAKLEKQALEARDPSSVRVAQHEAGELRAQNAKTQDQALGLLDRAEAAERRRADVRARIQSAREDLEQFRSVVETDAAALSAEIAMLTGRRDELLAGMEPVVREHFHALARRYPGKVVVPLRGDSCGGCGTRLTPNDAVKVRSKSAVSRCPSCVRIMVAQEVWSAAVEGATEA